MNTANLQLEGLYAAVAALMTALRQSGVVSEGDLDAALAEAEDAVTADRSRADDLSPAHLDAIAFPLRYLRLANRLGAEGSYPGFAELTARVGREKPQRAHLQALEREDIEASEDADVRRLEAIDGRDVSP
jgi:hypothetical protein